MLWSPTILNVISMTISDGSFCPQVGLSVPQEGLPAVFRSHILMAAILMAVCSRAAVTLRCVLTKQMLFQAAVVMMRIVPFRQRVNHVAGGRTS